MKHLYHPIIFIFFTFIFTTSFMVSETAAFNDPNENMVFEALSEAKNRIATAYVIVLKAEENGADTDELLDKLNIAGDWLSRGSIYFRMEELADALASAELCSQIASLVSVEAVEAADAARSERYRALLITTASTIVYLVGVSLGSLLIWRTWKRRYIGKIQKMEPKVSQ